MNHDKLQEHFNRQVAYLQKTVAPDDVYIFAQETLLAASYFLAKWAEWVDLNEEMTKDKASRIWINNIVALQKAQQEGVILNLNLDMRDMDELR